MAAPILLPAIKAAIQASDKSRRRIALESGVSEAMLCRFVSGERLLGVGNVEILAAYFKLEIIVRPKRRAVGGSRKALK